jgi:3-dehydroquinate synthase
LNLNQNVFFTFNIQLINILEKILIKTPVITSEILVGENWESVKKLLPAKGVVIVTDKNVHKHYGDKFPEFPVFIITPGEGSKKMKVIEELAQKLLDEGIDRNGFVLAIGGGVVCDLAGFLASIYMRGIRCGYVATSLLSQVDASTGGKNGVNLGGNKNILGTIRQPEFVICDQGMLKTLPDQEYLSGLAELIKTAIVGDRELFDLVEKHYNEIISKNCELMTGLISRSVKFKAHVVTEDEIERGLRRVLNFGHTFGHAIELEASLKHGFAVASGMALAAEFSFEKGLLSAAEKERIINLLFKFGLLGDHNITLDKIEQLILHDKKKSGTEIHFVFTEGIGKAVVKKVMVSELIDFYKKFTDKN